MIKVLSFFKRQPGTSVDSFQKHWRTRHAELVVRLPGLRRYVQNHTLASGYARKEPDFDGVAEAWFDDTDSLRRSGASAEYAAVKADEPGFLEVETLGSLLTEEVAIVDGAVPKGGVKMIAFLEKRPDVTVEFFQRYWRDHHGPLAATIPGLRRYVQCHVYGGIYAAGRKPVYDGAPMSWFEDLEAMRQSAESPEYRATRADEENFMISGRLAFSIAEEVEIPVAG